MYRLFMVREGLPHLYLKRVQLCFDPGLMLMWRIE
jgi:hypothetical protein